MKELKIKKEKKTKFALFQRVALAISSIHG